MKRRFISLEGSEGCGKSTQIVLLQQRLEARGERVLLTREPGGTPLGEKIRHLLKHAEEGKGMAPETELLLFSASRSELVRKVIEPALAEGMWVLSDRFKDSATVYQGIARGLSTEMIEDVTLCATGGVEPDLTLLLDLDPEEAARRVHLRSNPLDLVFDRIEEEDRAFFSRVRNGFLHLAADHPDRIKVIDSSRPLDAVADEIWNHLCHAFQL